MSRRNRTAPLREMFGWSPLGRREGRAYWCDRRRCFLWQYRYYCAAPPTAFVRWHGRVTEDHGLWQIVEYPGWDLSGPRLVIRERFEAAAEPGHGARISRNMSDRGWRIDTSLRYAPLGQPYIEIPVVSTTEPLPYVQAYI